MQKCPNPLPQSLTEALDNIAYEWARSPLRPRLKKGIADHWDLVVKEWADDRIMPLFIRRFNDEFPRGKAIRHASGRMLIPVDNTPAHWVLSLALREEVLGVEIIERMLAEDRIPIAMILKKKEKASAAYKCCGRKDLLFNDYGWKVCHKESVKFGRGNIVDMSLDSLKGHFCRFMSPQNMFLIPLQLGGLGELSGLIEIMKQFD